MGNEKSPYPSVLVKASDLAKATDQEIENAALIRFYRYAARQSQESALNPDARTDWRTVKLRVLAILDMRGLTCVESIRKGDYI